LFAEKDVGFLCTGLLELLAMLIAINALVGLGFLSSR